jgi:diketogulonate reductase-like aldo/keto reductase
MDSRNAPRNSARRNLLKAAMALSACAAVPGTSAAAAVKRPVPRSGELIAAVGLGTWQVFDVAGDPAATSQARDALAAFAKGGGQLIDSSPMYGSSEAVAGALCAELGLHRQLFLATKVWTRGKDEGVRQMRESMSRLRVDMKGPLDLMQVHNLVDVDTHLATLRAWKKEGMVRYLGITHYHAGAHAELERVLRAQAVDFMQVNYSLAEPQAEARLLDAAAAAGTAVIVNRPFAEGAMFARVKGKTLPPFAADFGAQSWAQLFLKWILSHPAVTCAIPGTREARHVIDNLGAMQGTLPDRTSRRRIRDYFQSL